MIFKTLRMGFWWMVGCLGTSAALANCTLTLTGDPTVCVGQQASYTAQIEGNTQGCTYNWTGATPTQDPRVATNTWWSCGTKTVSVKITGCEYCKKESTWQTGSEASTATDVVTLGSISVSGAIQVGSSTNWAAVKTSSTNDCVTITASLCPNNNSNCVALLSWSGGEQVPGQPRQRRVPKWVSAKTVVTASCCSSNLSAAIWILWGTVTIQTSGTTPPNAVQFGTLYDGTENLGGVTYASGTQGRGKVVPIAQLTPTGVHTVVTTGWAFKRERWFHTYKDGSQSGINDTNWTDDTSDASFQNLTPDSDDKIYDRDAPNVASFGATTCTEVYGKLHQWIEWNGTIASDGTPGSDTFPDDAKWHWRGKWQSSASPQVILTDVGGGYITLPSASAGCP